MGGKIQVTACLDPELDGLLAREQARRRRVSRSASPSDILHDAVARLSASDVYELACAEQTVLPGPRRTETRRAVFDATEVPGIGYLAMGLRARAVRGILRRYLKRRRPVEDAPAPPRSVSVLVDDGTVAELGVGGHRLGDLARRGLEVLKEGGNGKAAVPAGDRKITFRIDGDMAGWLDAEIGRRRVRRMAGASVSAIVREALAAAT